jgi:ABC-type uncharacterized transport system YnjBCD permease subunit
MAAAHHGVDVVELASVVSSGLSIVAALASVFGVLVAL